MAEGLGTQVKTLRTAFRLTQQQLGDKLGVSRQTIWNWEHGASQVPSADVPRLAEAFGISVAELYGEQSGSAQTGYRDATIRFVTAAPAEQTTNASLEHRVIRAGESHGSAGVGAQSSGYATRGDDDLNVRGRTEDLRGPGAKPLPIYRWGSLGDPRDVMSAPSPDREDYPPTGREGLIGPNGFGVEVRGESMVGRDIRDGDIVWVNPDRRWRLGGVVLALVDAGDGDSGMVVKTYSEADVGECLMSEPDSGKELLACREFKIIGPVVWIQRGFPPR